MKTQNNPYWKHFFKGEDILSTFCLKMKHRDIRKQISSMIQEGCK